MNNHRSIAEKWSGYLLMLSYKNRPDPNGKYAYNGLGQRVMKRGATDNSIVQYVYDPQGRKAQPTGIAQHLQVFRRLQAAAGGSKTPAASQGRIRAVTALHRGIQ